MQICAAGPGLIQKLGRVLKEKAQGDLDRVFNGASKTRERLGVRQPEGFPVDLLCQYKQCVSYLHSCVAFSVQTQSCANGVLLCRWLRSYLHIGHLRMLMTL